VAYKTKYNPKNKSKYIGNPSKIICRSLWERRVCKYLDENKNIIRWGSEEIAIPYYSPVDKRVHKYYPDFIVEKKTPTGVETLIIEVKPKKQTVEPERKKKKKSTYIKECMTYSVNESKWKAARKVCKEKGWNFVILTEDHILP
tara:strand:+ start:14828 stop:15259 length:432 start_codon:yes stop_codon:yes gene_type:complete